MTSILKTFAFGLQAIYLHCTVDNRQIRRKSFAIGLLTVIVLLPQGRSQTVPISAQTITVHGTVSDQTGAVIPGAQILLDSLGKGIAETIVSSEGHFSIQTELGAYVLKVSSPGFRTYQESVHWTSSTQEPMRIILQVAEGGGVNPCSSLCGVSTPPIPLLTITLSSLLPLQPLPPLRLHARNLKKLSR